VRSWRFSSPPPDLFCSERRFFPFDDTQTHWAASDTLVFRGRDGTLFSFCFRKNAQVVVASLPLATYTGTAQGRTFFPLEWGNRLLLFPPEPLSRIDRDRAPLFFFLCAGTPRPSSLVSPRAGAPTICAFFFSWPRSTVCSPSFKLVGVRIGVRAFFFCGRRHGPFFRSGTLFPR